MKHTNYPKITLFSWALTILGLTALFLTGCGENTEIEAYKANMNQFFENVRIIDDSINSLADNPESDTASQNLLQLLDSLDTTFAQMASLEVPEGFPGVEELADEASEYMSAAVTFYHQAYDGEYNASIRDVADQNYERANVRFQYIVSILHGDIPEEIYTYEDEESGDNFEEDSVEDEEAPDGEDTNGE